MVITESPPVLRKQNRDLETIAHVYKILANPTRLKILLTLESGSMTFTELMKTLDINPKTVSSTLTMMGKAGFVRKSYPHQVYVITPLGRRILREQVFALHESLHTALGIERGSS